MQMRENLTAVSNAEEGQFEEKLIRGTFCHSIHTGLRSEVFRKHMKRFVDPAAKITDGILLHRINHPSSEEKLSRQLSQSNQSSEH
jgi:hypothetical protein